MWTGRKNEGDNGEDDQGKTDICGWEQQNGKGVDGNKGAFDGICGGG